MYRTTLYWLSNLERITSRQIVLCLTAVILCFTSNALAEGTKQLEPPGIANSYCKLVLLQNPLEYRIPFALAGCSEEFRLNIRINDVNEKIYFGFGDIIDYFKDTTYRDVKYQVKDPDGIVVSAGNLLDIPAAGETGYISSRAKIDLGPDINNSNPGGYVPLVISPAKKGDYYIEFQIPAFVKNQIRVFKYIDITVANGTKPIPGRLWCKAWQLSSGNVSSAVSASYSLFYIYTNDSIVTRFDCNGMAGGVWDIYSNEWGCATSGLWSSRRQSITGNTSVKPEYKIFLNDPDPVVFPSGHIGKLNDFKVLNVDCDTVITFAADVSKAGNIEVMIDAPPLNQLGAEDIKLVYKVEPGYNILLPAWDGKDGYGAPLENGTQVKTRLSFLNGLSNVPLYDVEDNPKGFKVDLQRPSPVAGVTKLKLYWDDSRLPPDKFPTSNITEGCLYNSNDPVSGCHAWKWQDNKSLGDTNTLNTWWYLITDDSLSNPITLKIRPSSGSITGPASICSGLTATFRTTSIPFAKQYIWNLWGPGFSENFEINAPDTTFIHNFPASLVHGNYTLSVFGRNPQCRDGEKVFYNSYVYDYIPPPVTGVTSVCSDETNLYEVAGSFSKVHWSVGNGEIIGSPDENSVKIRWHTPGSDTLRLYTTTSDCGIRTQDMKIVINPVSNATFDVIGEATSCPGIPIAFWDQSRLVSGSVVERQWDWGDGYSRQGNDSLLAYSYQNTGIFNVTLKVTTDRGCQTEAIRQINIIPYPEASFSYFRNCLSQPIQLADNSTGIDLASWRWNFGSAPVTASNLNFQQPDAVYNKTGMFPVRLIVANKYGCRDTVIQQIAIHNTPVAAFSNEFPCQGTSIKFKDHSTMADTGIVQYVWNIRPESGLWKTYSGDSTLVIFENEGNTSVTHIVTDGYGCTDSITRVLPVMPQPESDFEITENQSNRYGNLHLVNLTTGAVTYSWDFGNGMTSDLPDPDIIYNLEGNYLITLIAASNKGCLDTTSKQYYYMAGLWFPNAFSPDNNGLNEIFRPVTQRTTLEPYQLQVYNRWGQLVFTSTDPADGWNGTFKEKPCETGVYSYIVQFRAAKIDSNETVTQRGQVTLIR